MPPFKPPRFVRIRSLSLVLAFVAAATLVASCGKGSPSADQGSSASSKGASATSMAPSVTPTPTSQATEAAVLPQGAERVALDPQRFTSTIDHPYWPMTPGNRWVYRETSASSTTIRIVVTVTERTKNIMGIKARVVHDIASADGQVVEDTYDWYAQDDQGNLWYMGEDTKEYENGQVISTAGSWQAGVDGAQAGIILPAEPRPGMTYRQEYLAGQAEDRARILSIDEKVRVSSDHFSDVLMTKDYSPLEPALIEHKFYAPGVGPVLTLTVSGGADREELVRFVSGL